MIQETGISSTGTTALFPGAVLFELSHAWARRAPSIDHLGAFRGLAFAMAFQLIFVAMVAVGCEVWRLIR